jgi:acyl-CoA synthetase (AMP-forming)/AMP-acid ligase II
VLSARAPQLGARAAIVDVDRTLTYDELLTEVRGVAAAFLARGVERGDRVAIWAPNQWRWVVAAIGAQLAGATLVPLNTRYKGIEASYVLDRTEPKVLLMVGRFLGEDYPRLLADAGWGPPASTTVVMIDDSATAGTTFRELLAGGRLIDDDAVTERAAQLGPDDPSDVLFTSGTTGRPKGVVTDHGQNLHAYYDWSTLAGMREGDRYAVIPPFFHAFGYKVGWLSSLMHGMTMYPHASLDVDVLTRQIAEEGINIVPGPPTLFHTLLDREAEIAGRATLRLAIIGAATIPPVLVRRMKEELGFERVTTCYGLTEATGVATISREEDPLDLVLTTAGRAVPDVEVAVLDEGDPEPRQVGGGEIVVRGYNIMRGYLTASGLGPAPVDASGWLHTGDVGTLDERGYLRVTDRKNDLYVVGGFNVSPAEVEKTLAEHPDVEQVAVIGVPDQRLGEVGMAFVVARQPGRADADLLIAWCRTRLANFKVPRLVRFVTELPRNATGKVVKGELRRQAGVAPPPG